MFRALNIFMAVLFALSIVVQLNDPDPLRWILVYAFGLLVTLMAVFGRHTVLSAVCLVIYLGGALYFARGFAALDSPINLFTDIKMDYEGVEEARESGGLLIGAAWMLVLSVVWYRGRNASPVAADSSEETSA